MKYKYLLESSQKDRTGEEYTTSDKIRSVLKKYKKGHSIDSEDDLKVLERYASTGMVRLSGFNYKTKKGEAVLTDQGKWFLKQL